MRNANYIVHQKIAMMQLRQAVLFCYLQLLRQFLSKPDFTRPLPLPSRAGSADETTGYAYNKNGTKKNFTYPNGTTVNYTYDANNQLTGVNVPYAGNISYDAYQWTRPTGITLPSGSGAKQYAYDELMRTKTITSNDSNQNALMNYQYSYDKMDNIKTRNTQTGNYAYNYDNLYRLNEVKKDDTQTENYTYDAVGNRLTSATTTGDWTYNSNNELLAYNNTANQYDANGNTIQRTINGTIQNFVYDVDNRLIEVKDSNNNTIAAYTYDPFGRRIKKQTGVNGQPLPSPLAGEGQGEGVITTYYLYSDEGLIGEYDSSGSQIRIYGYKPNSTWSTDPLFMREGGNIYFYHNDHLGTPQKMTNISGNVVWSATYDAFGKATVDASSTITNNLRFPGQYFDAETGLHYNWNRYYDFNTGRYVTEDPIGLGGGINLSLYVNGNPVSLYDDLGLAAKKCLCMNITIKRKEIKWEFTGLRWPPIDFTDYGHWWIELGKNESYGWWPSKAVTEWETIKGVPGILNRGYHKDPHHGDNSDVSFNPVATSEKDCDCKKICKKAADCIRSFAKEFKGIWQYPDLWGDNCHSFQKAGMRHCNLDYDF